MRAVRVFGRKWDGPGSLVTFAKMARAALTGTKPELGKTKSVAF